MNRLLLGIVVLAPLVVPARAQTLADRLESARTAARVEVALARDEALSAFTFRSTAEAGVVTVTGVVETPAHRKRVAAVAAGVDGVTRVVNSVQTRRAAADGRIALPTVEETEPVEEEAAEPEPEPQPEEVYHTVRSGDTLGAIARRYGVSVRTVQQLNGLRGSGIRVGQRLRVK